MRILNCVLRITRFATECYRKDVAYEIIARIEALCLQQTDVIERTAAAQTYMTARYMLTV